MPFAQNTRCLWHRFGSRWLGIDLLAAVSKIFNGRFRIYPRQGFRIIYVAALSHILSDGSFEYFILRRFRAFLLALVSTWHSA